MSRSIIILLGFVLTGCVLLLALSRSRSTRDFPVPAAPAARNQIVVNAPPAEEVRVEGPAHPMPPTDATVSPASPAEPPETASDFEDMVERLHSGELLAGMANEGFQARAEEVERERRGRARFQEGVARSGITARDIPEAVVRVFGAMDLAPDLDEEGMLLGLRIRGLDDDSVMSAAGFRVGDRITALDDSELHDPADLPELLARSATELNVCAQRAGEAFCRKVSLE